MVHGDAHHLVQRLILHAVVREAARLWTLLNEVLEHPHVPVQHPHGAGIFHVLLGPDAQRPLDGRGQPGEPAQRLA
eukprot:8367911-Prorocentrum_lima.AAC.1